MKFSRIHEGQLSLVFSLCLLVTSCNPEEYYPVEELVEGADAYCAKATDLQSCQQLADVCQPAYEPLELDLNEPVFSTCVANPDMWNPVYDDPDAPTDPVTDPSDPTDPGTDPTDPTDPGTDPSDPTDPGTDPSDPTDPGTDPSDPTDPGTDPVVEEPQPAPSIEDTVAQKCANLDPEHLWVKKSIKKKKVIKVVKKVKICHITGNSQSHTIVIACPALNAHKQHHDDYIGACEL